MTTEILHSDKNSLIVHSSDKIYCDSTIVRLFKIISSIQKLTLKFTLMCCHSLSVNFQQICF